MQTTESIAKKAQFEIEFYKELQNTYMLIYQEIVSDENSDYIKWYESAIDALRFATPRTISCKMSRFLTIDEIVDGGVNLNNVAYLCNNLESLSADKLQISFENYKNIIRLNNMVASYWLNAIKPIRELVENRIRLSNGIYKGNFPKA